MDKRVVKIFKLKTVPYWATGVKEGSFFGCTKGEINEVYRLKKGDKFLCARGTDNSILMFNAVWIIRLPMAGATTNKMTERLQITDPVSPTVWKVMVKKLNESNLGKIILKY